MIKVDIYDLECFPNFFSYTGIDRDIKKLSQYYIHDSDKCSTGLHNFFIHTAYLKGQIGFNNLNYDGQLINYLLQNEQEFILLSPKELTNKLYEFSQRLIKIDKNKGDKYPYYTYFIPQLDLYRIHHFDNKAKAQNLKGIEFHLQFENVEDMPFSHDHWVEEGDIPQIMSYNLNDVRATEAFYEKTKPMIELRKQLGKQYNLNFLNDSNAKIGTEIILDLYCKHTKQRKNEVRKMRTYRNDIPLESIIFPIFKS